MKAILVIGIGSFIGGVLRFLISNTLHTKFPNSAPWGTWLVNIIGCFMIGVVFALISTGKLDKEWRHFLTVGLMGGFTTFSSFSFETVILMEKQDYFHAAVYVLSSVLLGVIASFIGYKLFVGKIIE